MSRNGKNPPIAKLTHQIPRLSRPATPWPFVVERNMSAGWRTGASVDIERLTVTIVVSEIPIGIARSWGHDADGIRIAKRVRALKNRPAAIVRRTADPAAWMFRKGIGVVRWPFPHQIAQFTRCGSLQSARASLPRHCGVDSMTAHITSEPLSMQRRMSKACQHATPNHRLVCDRRMSR